MKQDVFAPLKKIGHPLMLCDVIYQQGSKLTEWHDYINFVYKDLTTNEKHLFTIEDPLYDIYTVKPQFRTFKKARDFLERSKLTEHTVHYKDRFIEMARLADSIDGGNYWTSYIKNTRNFQDKREIFLYPYILGGDIAIETYYISKWANELGNDAPKEVTSFFLDIECNLKGYTGTGIPRNGECSIDAITLIDGVTKISHTFLYKTPDNPQIDDFLTPEKRKEFKEKAADMFSDFDDMAEYRCYMFEDELEMLRQLFVLIHQLRRDFGMIWNGCGFDLPYLYNRIKKLGGDPKKFFCHPDFPTDTLYMFDDQKTFNFDQKRSFVTCSSYTHWIDQLIQYASLRKSQGAMKKFSLDFVAQFEEIGSKIDHSDIGNFSIFSYVDYMTYVLYNIKDVLLQYGIDKKCNDMTRYWSQCYNNCSPLKDGLKQTISLRWMLYHVLKYDYDMILGHNVNFKNADYTKNEDDDDEDEDDSYGGAINSNPMLNDEVGMMLFGKNSRFLFKDAIDFDFSAMYPNIIYVFNIFKTTMVGKLIIIGVEDLLSYDEDAGKEFIEDYIAQDAIFMGHKWFNLPDTLEMADLINDALQQKYATA